jgi:hypothetical protein
MDEEQDERRQVKRAPVDAACLVLTDGGGSISVTVLDISSTGMAVEMHESLQFEVMYVFALELRGPTRPTRLNALAKVVYVAALGPAFRIGLQFVDMDSCSRFHLNALQEPSRYQG